MGVILERLPTAFNSLAPGKRSGNLKLVIFNSYQGQISWAFPVKLPSGECHRRHWWLVNIDSGNGLVPSGTKPLMNQCWPSSMMLYHVTRPQWVNRTKNANLMKPLCSFKWKIMIHEIPKCHSNRDMCKSCGINKLFNLKWQQNMIFYQVLILCSYIASG